MGENAHEKGPGYCTTTYCLRLYCRHRDWLEKTGQIYNQVLVFYYEVLKQEAELAELSSRQKLLRQLELLTVGARGQAKETIKHPLPYEKVPLYFRRAAANDAIRIYRSRKSLGGQERLPFHASPVFYKGMYRDFTEASITLKLWNGEAWIWEVCRLDTCGRTLPDAGLLLSPLLKLDGKRSMLHVPVRREVKDVRTVQERFPEEALICAAAFPGNDCLAVLTVLGKDGACRESLFIRGGSRLAHEKKKLLNRMSKNRASMGNRKTQDGTANALPEAENRHIKEKIKNLTETYAHRTSRQIVAFCEERNIRILVVPNYRQSLNLNQLGYLSASSYDWIGRRIIQYLRYKAFEKGIVVTAVSTKGIADTCYACGEPVKRFNKNNKPGRRYYGGKNYICSNGHQGNAYFNSSMNIGRRFLMESEEKAAAFSQPSSLDREQQKSREETSGRGQRL